MISWPHQTPKRQESRLQAFGYAHLGIAGPKLGFLDSWGFLGTAGLAAGTRPRWTCAVFSFGHFSPLVFNLCDELDKCLNQPEE